MTISNGALSAIVVATLLLAGCGDDLESRNAAAGYTPSEEREAAIAAVEAANTREEVEPANAAEEDADQPQPEGFADGGDTEDEDASDQTVVDASPDDLRDTTQGFAPEPLDDASGINPSPMVPEPFEE